jgi:hypothetical protein
LEENFLKEHETMKINQLYVLGVMMLTVILSTATLVRADDDQDSTAKEQPQKVRVTTVGDQPLKIEVTAVDDQPQKEGQPRKIEKRITVVAQAGGEYWIGVYAVPVEAALKSHLGIEDRLIVQQVIADSPAKKAGIQNHDVLLKYGDSSITTVEDLIKAVGKSKGKETSLELIRGGKKMSINVTAEKRPENQLGIITEDLGDLGVDVRGLIGQWVENQGADKQSGSPLKFRIVGPGVIDHKVGVSALHKALIDKNVKTPKNLSIQINKTGDTPAKIKVTLDDEAWEVTEDNLEELPENVRPHVRRSLGGRAGIAIGFAPDGQHLRLKALQVHPGEHVIQGVTPRAIFQQKGSSPAARAIQILRKSVDSDVDIEQLHKDVEALKAAVKTLQAGKPKKKKKDND